MNANDDLCVGFSIILIGTLASSLHALLFIGNHGSCVSSSGWKHQCSSVAAMQPEFGFVGIKEPGYALNLNSPHGVSIKSTCHSASCRKSCWLICVADLPLAVKSTCRLHWVDAHIHLISIGSSDVMFEMWLDGTASCLVARSHRCWFFQTISFMITFVFSDTI